jgi:uncharacterized protein YunC (DUF1805 family)
VIGARHEIVVLGGKRADGFVIPLGPANLVAVMTDVGMVACGAFDVLALERFDYPAAKAKAARGDTIVTVSDLLVAKVTVVNAAAAQRGIAAGMSGRDALERL